MNFFKKSWKIATEKGGTFEQHTTAKTAVGKRWKRMAKRIKRKRKRREREESTKKKPKIFPHPYVTSKSTLKSPHPNFLYSFSICFFLFSF